MIFFSSITEIKAVLSSLPLFFKIAHGELIGPLHKEISLEKFP